MKNLIKPLALITGMSLMAFSCKKDNNNNNNNNNNNTAGKGGSGVIRAIPKHHTRLIDSCTIYIKYNATTAPSSYDDSIKCVKVNDTAQAIFTGLKNGNYYLYGYGYDTSISKNVSAGIAFTLSAQDTEKVYVPVTEGD